MSFERALVLLNEYKRKKEENIGTQREENAFINTLKTLLVPPSSSSSSSSSHASTTPLDQENMQYLGVCNHIINHLRTRKDKPKTYNKSFETLLAEILNTLDATFLKVPTDITTPFKDVQALFQQKSTLIRRDIDSLSAVLSAIPEGKEIKEIQTSLSTRLEKIKNNLPKGESKSQEFDLSKLNGMVFEIENIRTEVSDLKEKRSASLPHEIETLKKKAEGLLAFLNNRQEHHPDENEEKIRHQLERWILEDAPRLNASNLQKQAEKIFALEKTIKKIRDEKTLGVSTPFLSALSQLTISETLASLSSSQALGNMLQLDTHTQKFFRSHPSLPTIAHQLLGLAMNGMPEQFLTLLEANLTLRGQCPALYEIKINKGTPFSQSDLFGAFLQRKVTPLMMLAYYGNSAFKAVFQMIPDKFKPLALDQLRTFQPLEEDEKKADNLLAFTPTKIIKHSNSMLGPWYLLLNSLSWLRDYLSRSSPIKWNESCIKPAAKIIIEGNNEKIFEQAEEVKISLRIRAQRELERARRLGESPRWIKYSTVEKTILAKKNTYEFSKELLKDFLQFLMLLTTIGLAEKLLSLEGLATLSSTSSPLALKRVQHLLQTNAIFYKKESDKPYILPADSDFFDLDAIQAMSDKQIRLFTKAVRKDLAPYVNHMISFISNLINTRQAELDSVMNPSLTSEHRLGK